MADDKPKTKIDLKARLGKTQMGLQGGPSLAPPMAGPSMPAPSGPGIVPPPAVGGMPQMNAAPAPTPSVHGFVPTPGIAPQIPLPPFGQQRIPQAQPSVPKLSAAQQTIKVDVGEEIELERQKSKKRAVMVGLVGAAIGLGIGFIAGGQKEKADRGVAAVVGAGALEKDVKAANDKMKELSDKLNDASEKVSKKTFPDDIVASLGAINVPFDATNLEGKQVGSLGGKVFKALLSYTTAVQDLNKTKDSIKGLMTQAAPQIKKAWGEETNPMANFSVVFRGDPGNKLVAELAQNKEPFAWKSDFPATYTVLKVENGKVVEKKATRVAGNGQKADIAGGTDVLAIPVEPKTTAAFTSEVLVARLNKALFEIRRDLEGNKDDPTKETAGLLKEGEDLANALHAASLLR